MTTTIPIPTKIPLHILPIVAKFLSAILPFSANPNPAPAINSTKYKFNPINQYQIIPATGTTIDKILGRKKETNMQLFVLISFFNV